jgi:hypothetical protein
LTAVLVAAALGAGLFWAYSQTLGQNCSTTATSGLLEGAVIGAGVQIGVRLLGVS